MKLIGFKSRHSLITILLLISSMIMSSCVQNSGLRGRAVSSIAAGNLTGGTTNGGVNALPGESSVPGIGTASTVISQMVELSHFVDPFDGTYKKKLTIPKNFKGNLYLSGLNVASLSNKLVQVRFNFGRERQSISMGATIARAPGIIPNTAIQVLVVDMNNAPFSNLRLGYDLYDYNDYAGNPTLDVASDPRDGGLYCRGLLLEDDPTFLAGQGTTCNGTIGSTGTAAVCKYSYAKITDATLQYPDPIIPTIFYDKIPTKPLVWAQSELSPDASATFMANMCLPDTNDSLAFSPGIIPVAAVTAGLPGQLKYNTPYRSINSAEWQISSAAILSPTGLYSGTLAGFKSLLFPISGKLSLGPNINYYGSTSMFTARGPLVSDATGTTQYVDGCNIRAMNFNPITNEGIGSCNVSASVEVFYLNSVGQEVLITKDNAIKLQLIRPSSTNYLGKEVLTSAFKTCSSSSTCGASECCYNQRCWSKDLVTQCVDQLPIIGNQVIGANCSSDYECTSLCCNSSTGSCAPHNPNGTIPNYCSKSPGQQCVSKEFCRKDFVSECKVIFTNLMKPDGISRVCTLRCNPVEMYGSCLGSGSTSTCIPPAIPRVPSQVEIDTCVNAVDP